MSIIPNLDHIYILVHPELEKDRYNYLQKLLTVFPKEYITFITPIYKGIDNINFAIPRVKNVEHHISIGALCLYLTYEKLMKHILENTNYTNVLVLESDVLFNDQTLYSELNIIIQEWITINNWQNSMIFLGNGCNFKAKEQNKKTDHIYLENSSKCTDSMLWSRQSIQNILPYLENINRPIDLKLNVIFDNKISDSYWIEPHIFTQGSQNGTYKRTI